MILGFHDLNCFLIITKLINLLPESSEIYKEDIDFADVSFRFVGIGIQL